MPAPRRSIFELQHKANLGNAIKAWPAVEREFANALYQQDLHVGQLMRILDETALAESTIVLYASDNGPMSVAYHDHRFF